MFRSPRWWTFNLTISAHSLSWFGLEWLQESKGSWGRWLSFFIMSDMLSSQFPGGYHVLEKHHGWQWCWWQLLLLLERFISRLAFQSSYLQEDLQGPVTTDVTAGESPVVARWSESSILTFPAVLPHTPKMMSDTVKPHEFSKCNLESLCFGKIN